MQQLAFFIGVIMLYTALLMETIGDKVRKYRKLQGFSLDDVARLCATEAGYSVTGGYIGRLERWEDGYQNPSIETLRAIAKVLKVELKDILPDFGEQLAKIGIEDVPQTHAARMIPVIGKAACGKWADFTDLEYPAGHADRWEMSPSKDPNAFFIIAKGHSMVGDDIQDGDLLLVEPNSEVKNGDIVLAKDDGKGCTVKRFYKNKDGSITLLPMNPDFEPMHVQPHERLKLYRVRSKTSYF